MSTELVLADMWVKGEIQRRGDGRRAVSHRRGLRSWWRARRAGPDNTS